MGEEVSTIRQIQIATNRNTQQTEPSVLETLSTPSLQPTFPINTELLIAKGKKVYLDDGRLLKNVEVEQRFRTSPEALQLYQKGQSKYKMGDNYLFVGVLYLGGSAIMLGLADGDEDITMIGSIFAIASPIMFTAGFILKSSGKKHVQSAVNTYNRTNTTSNVEFDFGFTKNGIGLVMRF